MDQASHFFSSKNQSLASHFVTDLYNYSYSPVIIDNHINQYKAKVLVD